ncbi:MAG: M48 family metallopeptidase [Bacteroidales bacterium]|nr:M48 family metallopeptidase [Bacteroidales bacterium]MDT8433023.1 M48 family metallopeptidase [Bacteroidales bacterium]
MKILRPLFVILLALTVSCSNVPLTGRKQFTAIPSSQMQELSADSYSQVLSEQQLSDNTAYVNAVTRVGKKVVAAVEEYLLMNGLEARIDDFNWRFNVLESEEVNAWCMPGGQIAFYEGIMPICGDDNGIAIVMGHEIAHAIAKHGNERMSQQMLISMGGVALSEALETEKEATQQLALLAFGVGTQLGVSLPYSRTHESEADELGLYFMAMAGYDPRTAPAFWERMEQAGGARPPEFLSTHPDPLNRVQHLHEMMPKAMEYYNAAQ